MILFRHCEGDVRPPEAIRFTIVEIASLANARSQ
jgi:hypothetical protein